MRLNFWCFQNWVSLGIALFIFAATIPCLSEEPWSNSEKAPVIREEILRGHNILAPQDNFWNNRFDHGYYFYQKMISPADGARCGMIPTCADFGYQAIQKHGPILGGWMATDRFMRDHGKEEQNYPLIEKFGRMRLSDPVSANDFWFLQ